MIIDSISLVINVNSNMITFVHFYFNIFLQLSDIFEQLGIIKKDILFI